MRRTRTCPAGAATVMFVEGGDEERLCRELLGPRASTVFWMTFDGRTPQNIRNRIQAARGEPGWPDIRNIGIVIDAEESVEDAAHTLEVAATELGVALGAPGVVVSTSSGTVGCYLLPDNSSPGGLETLLRRTAEPTPAACVETLFQCTPNPGTTQAQRDKAWLSAYLAVKCGNPRVNQAWVQRALDPAHAELDGLRDFLWVLIGPRRA